MALHALNLWKIDETLFFDCAHLQDFYFDQDLLQLGIVFSNSHRKVKLIFDQGWHTIDIYLIISGNVVCDIHLKPTKYLQIENNLILLGDEEVIKSSHHTIIDTNALTTSVEFGKANF